MIAIVLINYNNKNDTIDCVKSIKKSVNILPPYIVVVDNNSSEKISVGDFDFYDNIKIIHSEYNIGFGKSNNLALHWILKNLNSNYVFILNNDTLLRSDTIYNLLNNFPNNKETVAASPKILTYERKPKIWFGGGSFDFNRMSIKVDNINQPDKKLDSIYVDFISGCAMFFKTDYLKNNRLFDPVFFMYDEDVELCLNIKKQKKKIYFISDSVIFHKCQGSQKKNVQKNINQLHPKNKNVSFYLSMTIPNRFFILKKYFKGFNRVLYQLSLSFYFLSKSIQFLLFGKFRLMFLTITLVIKSNFKTSQ